MCKAIQNNLNWSSGNTQVVTNDGVSTVYLHGNKIALVDDNSMTIFDGGWQSNTTKSRLNALINEFCNGFTDGVFQKDFLWWIRDNNEVKPFVSGYLFAWRNHGGDIKPLLSLITSWLSHFPNQDLNPIWFKSTWNFFFYLSSVFFSGITMTQDNSPLTCYKREVILSHLNHNITSTFPSDYVYFTPMDYRTILFI